MKPFPKQPGVIYLDRQRLDFFGSNMVTNIVHLDFPINVIKDLEVAEKDELSIIIKAFIEFYKIIPSSVVLVLSPNIYFENNLPLSQENPPEAEIQNFLDNIPFENIESKVFREQSQAKIIATNKDLCEEIKNAFEKQGFIVEAVIPEFVLGKYIPFKNSMDLETCRLILEKFDSFKPENLLTKQVLLPSEQTTPEDFRTKSKNNLKLIILIVIFLSLFGVLSYMLIKTTLTKSSVPKFSFTSEKLYKTT